MASWGKLLLFAVRKLLLYCLLSSLCRGMAGAQSSIFLFRRFWSKEYGTEQKKSNIFVVYIFYGSFLSIF